MRSHVLPRRREAAPREVFAADTNPAQQTAKMILAATQPRMPVEVDAALGEICTGAWTGLEKEAVAAEVAERRVAGDSAGLNLTVLQ